MLEDPNHIADTEIFHRLCRPNQALDQKEFIEVEFKDGCPIREVARDRS